MESWLCCRTRVVCHALYHEGLSNQRQVIPDGPALADELLFDPLISCSSSAVLRSGRPADTPLQIKGRFNLRHWRIRKGSRKSRGAG